MVECHGLDLILMTLLLTLVTLDMCLRDRQLECVEVMVHGVERSPHVDVSNYNPNKYIQ